MAQPGDEIKRELPRLSKSIRQTEKAVAKNTNKINKNTQDVSSAKQKLANIEGDVRELDRRQSKTEKVVNKVQKEVVDATTKADQAQQTANNAELTASQAVKQTQLLAVQNTVSALNRNFGTFNKSVTNNLSGIQSKLSNNSLLFNNQKQDLETQVAQVSQQLGSNFQQLQVLKTDLVQGLGLVQADVGEQKQNTLQLSETVNAKLGKDLVEQKNSEKSARLEAANKRKELRENILEGAGKAVQKVGGAVSGAANSLLGGFNLLDALKGVLGKLLLGLAINNFDKIYNYLSTLLSKWKRITAVFVRQFARPVARFFGAIIDVGVKVLKFTGKILNGARKFFGKVLGFATTVGKKVLSAIGSFISRIWNAGRAILNPRGGTDPGNSRGNTGSNAGGANAGGADGVDTGKGTGGKGAPSAQGRNRQPDRLSRISGAKNSGKTWKTEGKMPTGSVKSMQKQLTNIFKEAQSKLAPILQMGKDTAGKVMGSLGKGDTAGAVNAVGELSENIGKQKGLFKSLSNIMAPVGGLMRALGPAAVGIVKRFGQITSTGFPIDVAINKYLLDMGWEESLVRALGSTLGSILGKAGGPFGLITSMLGAEAGDLVFALLGRAAGRDYSSDNNLYNSTPFIGEQIKEIGNSFVTKANPNAFDGSGTGTRMDGSKSPAEPMSKMGTGISLPSPASSPQISQSKSVAAIVSMPSNDHLRKKTKASGSGNTQVTNVSLPVESVQAPTNVVNNGPKISQKDASPLPSISSSNTAMQFYENYAASQFNLQLV